VAWILEGLVLQAKPIGDNREAEMSNGKRVSRRGWLRKLVPTMAASGLGMAGTELQGADGGQSRKVRGVDYYKKLGVTPFINAAGTYTVLSASLLPDEVRAAMSIAARSPVNINELHEAAGAYLAKRLRCEAALVTAGAASALTLGTAACISLGNEQAIINLPADMTGLKNEVLIQKAHRFGYDHAVRNCGIKFVEVESLEQYEAAFNERTVLALFYNAGEGGWISREDWIRVAQTRRVPTFNDAAADVPPISNLWNYTQMGFDLVTFSGGKGLRGPQCSGLLLGRKDLIDWARRNNSPNANTVGRGMKVGKEEIIGLVAAVDWFLAQDDEIMEEEFRRRASRIAARLQRVPTLETRIVIPPVANRVPHLLITYDTGRVKITPLEVMEKLRQGQPRIELNPATGTRPAGGGLPTDERTIVVGVWMLEPGQDLVVARRLREVLQAAAG